MQVIINSKAVTLPDSAPVSLMLETLQTAQEGVAVAVNQAIVSRSEWSDYILSEGDQVMLIKATAGG
ncbi:sulfur carrier protein ThiS [Endozoicomonadaceae bacterium StTr2]